MLLSASTASVASLADALDRRLETGSAFGGRPGASIVVGAERAVEQFLDRADLFQIARWSAPAATLPAACASRRRARAGSGRGPIIETSDITSSSRIGSIGGLVTCAKFCLK